MLQAPLVFTGELPVYTRAWIPAIGLTFSFRVSGFGFLFALLVLGIGMLIILYARYYIAREDPMGRFYTYLLLFMGSNAGHCAVGKPDPAHGVLGADQYQLVPAHRLLAAPGRCPQGRSWPW